MSAAPPVLKCVIFLGSMRPEEKLGPFPGRVGTRVSKFLVSQLQKDFEIKVVDPSHPDYTLPLLNLPYHWSKMLGREISPEVQRLNDLAAWADCYIFVTPEYNRSIAPALANMIHHIAPPAYGGKMALKPSLMVTYTMGKYGGVRASTQLESLASEIGTLVLPKQLNIIEAHINLNKNGEEVPPNKDDLDMLPITFALTQAKKDFVFVARAMQTARQAEALEKKKKKEAKL